MAMIATMINSGVLLPVTDVNFARFWERLVDENDISHYFGDRRGLSTVSRAEIITEGALIKYAFRQILIRLRLASCLWHWLNVK